MNSFNQGDLFIVKLESIIKLEGELAGHELVLRITNLAVDQAVFQTILEQEFVEGVIEMGATSTKVTLTRDAETMIDGNGDGIDVDSFLQGIAESILNQLEKTPGWGSDNSADKRAPYDLLD